MATIRAEDGFLFNTVFTTDFRVRTVVYDMLLKARLLLPPGYRLVVYEGFRPRRRQWELWNGMIAEMRRRHPGESDEQIEERTREFVADPRGFGSGHQAGGAIDVSLAGPDGRELNMGTAVDEVSDKTPTHSPHLTTDERANRAILLSAMEGAGLVNYPSEWWHYSYGDRLWAELTGSPVAFFAPLPE
jgi:D-alanyl-D-alanine dipeptidase